MLTSRVNALFGVALGLLSVLAPSCGTSRGDDTPDPLVTTDSSYVCASEMGASLNRIVESAGDGAFSGSILVAKGSQIVLCKGYGLAHVSGRPNTPLTVYDAGSLAKTFTALAVLQLAESGNLRLDQTLGDFFPNIPADKRHITIHQILTHTAGFVAFHGGGDFQRLNRNDALHQIFKTALQYKPGSRYEYSNSGYTVLAAIIEEVSDEDWVKYLTRHIFVPAGMDYTGFYGDQRWKQSGVAHGYTGRRDRGSPLSWKGPYWVLVGNGGLVTNVVDLFRWHRALQSGALIGSPWREELTRARISSEGYLPSLYRGIREVPKEAIQVSYFGWRYRGPGGVLIDEKGGAMEYGHTALLRYEPELDVLIVLLSNRWVEDEEGRLLRVPIMDELQAAVFAAWQQQPVEQTPE